MARVMLVGPLRLWSEHGSHGDVLICEHAGERKRYPRSDRSARSALAWQAYQTRSLSAANTYPHVPRG